MGIPDRKQNQWQREFEREFLKESVTLTDDFSDFSPEPHSSPGKFNATEDIS